MGKDEHHRRRERRAREIEEQRGAVGVAPLRVVDVDDEGPTAGQGEEEFAQRPERAPSNALRVDDGLLARLADARHATEDGEQAGERPRVPRLHEGALEVVDVHQVAAERIDDAVEGLVGHRLSLVGAPSKHDRIPFFHPIVEKNAGGGSTCPSPDRPRTRTVTPSAPRATLRTLPPPPLERSHGRFATDETHAAHGVREGRTRRQRPSAPAETAQEVSPTRPPSRLALE